MKFGTFLFQTQGSSLIVSRIILFGGPGTRDALAAMEQYQQHLLSKF